MLLVRKSGESNLIFADCLSSDVAGAPVYITGPAVSSRPQVATADATDGTRMPAVGFIEQKITATSCMVRIAGELKGVVTGLTPGKPVFVGTGNVTHAPLPIPTAPYTYTQTLGVASAANTIMVHPNMTITKRRG